MDIEQNSVEIVPVGLHQDAVPPVLCRESGVDWRGRRDRLGDAVRSWLASSPSVHIGAFASRDGAHDSPASRCGYHRPARFRRACRSSHDARIHPQPGTPFQVADVRATILMTVSFPSLSLAPPVLCRGRSPSTLAGSNRSSRPRLWDSFHVSDSGSL